MTKLNGKNKGPEVDPDYLELMKHLNRYKASDLFEKTWVSRTTIHNHQRGKVKRPQHATMQAEANAMGMEYRLIRRK